MEKLYYHPDRSKMKNIPVFTNYYQYQAITYFLRLAEYLEPHLIKDLDELIPLYNETEKSHKIDESDRNSFIDNWDILDKANVNNNPHLVHLKEAVIAWAKKFNLVDEHVVNKTFLEIGVWAIPDRRDHPQSVEEWKEYFTKKDREAPRDVLNWSIADVIYFEDELQDIEKVKTKEEIFTEEEFPFLFTPSFQNIEGYKLFGEKEDAASDYENVLFSYELDIFHALKGEKEKIGKFPTCEGWDPRNDTWGEFEKKLDAAYKKYKELYRERTEAHLERKGYVEGKEKRNKEHFEWLVRYQIQNWTVKEIADYYSKDDKILSEDTIKKALSNTASMVGLQLRKHG